MSSKRTVSVKTRTELGKVLSYLQQVVDCLRNGTLCVQNGQRGVVLKPLGLVELEVEATHKEDKQSLVLEISWRKKEMSAREADLIISSDESVLAAAGAGGEEDAEEE